MDWKAKVVRTRATAKVQSEVSVRVRRSERVAVYQPVILGKLDLCARPSTARFFDADSLRCPKDSRDPHAVGDRLLSVQVFEIGGDRVGETPPSRNRHYRSLLLGFNSRAVGSSRATFVPMMKPTHLGDRDDSPGFWRSDWA